MVSIASKMSRVAQNDTHREGDLTRAIERQTAKVPSVGYLSLAIGSMVLSAALQVFSRKKEYGNFVGLWAPSLLLIGIYNKLVKLEGSDRFESGTSRERRKSAA